MKTNEIKSISFHLIVVILGVKYTLCQRRGNWNFEHSPPKPESWLGGLQPIVHGKLKEGESPLQALYREMHGDAVAKVVNNVEHYSREVDGNYELFSSFHLHSSSGGLQLVTLADCDQITDLKNLPKNQPVNGLAMFTDDLSVMRELLAGN